MSTIPADSTGMWSILAPVLQGFRLTPQVHGGRAIKLGEYRRLYGREACFSLETGFAAEIFVRQNIKQHRVKWNHINKRG